MTIPTRVTLRVVAMRLAMILAEGYGVVIYGAVLPILTQVPVAGGREVAAPGRSLFDASTLRAPLPFWVAMFMGLLLLYGLSTWLPQLMRKSGFALGSSLGLLVMLNATAATGSLVGGAVADRLGSRPVVSVLYLHIARST